MIGGVAKSQIIFSLVRHRVRPDDCVPFSANGGIDRKGIGVLAFGQLLAAHQDGLLGPRRSVQAAPLVALELGVVDLDGVVDEEVAQDVRLEPVVARHAGLAAPVPHAAEAQHLEQCGVVRSSRQFQVRLRRTSPRRWEERSRRKACVSHLIGRRRQMTSPETNEAVVSPFLSPFFRFTSGTVSH